MTVRVEGLAVEQAEEGSPIGTARPRLSWRIEGGPDDGLELSMVEVELAAAGVTEVRESGLDGPVLREWPFRDLASRETGTVRVRAGDGEQWTEWSAPRSFVVGLLDGSDWSASFISPLSAGGLDTPAPILSKEFELGAAPASARVWATALGVYALRINGIRVGTDELAPGWTAYEHRLRYQSYDVGPLLRSGRNVIEATLGNGWYRGYLTWDMDRTNYGDRLALLAQLEVDLEDGSAVRVDTDASWNASSSVIVSDDLYNGERHEPAAVAETEGVEVVDFDRARLVARRGPAVRITQSVRPVRSFSSPSGRLIVDFGQNLVGRVRLIARGAAPSTEVTVRHAEVLEHGELALRPLGNAKATCSYVLAGGAEEVLAPVFTFSGFRYIQIDGLVPDLDDIVAEVMGTDLARTGRFECADTQLNQLHSNIVWGARGNFLDLPTDCPQRAERLGWTGDIQVFAPTANFLFDTSGFLAGWLEDLAAEQLDDGSVPWIIPNVYPGDWVPSAGWGDAATLVPLALHDAFADDAMLRRQFPSMRGWVDKIESLADSRGVWLATGQIGDWLDPDAPPEDPAAAKADPAVIATAYLFHSTRAVAEAARRLGLPVEELRYTALADRVAAGFDDEFVDQSGRIRSDCQTVYALALVFGLLREERRSGAGRRLAELVELAGATVSTGFLGTPHILDALCIAGRPDLAHRMLRQTALPSWLYSVEMGATTVWERWDSLLPDGRVNPGSMTSFNHYAYGAVGDFLHRRVGGLRMLEPGYRRFAVEPVPGELASASVSLDSASGRIDVSWRRDSAEFVLDLSVPFGAEAEVLLPGAAAPVACGWGEHRLRSAS